MREKKFKATDLVVVGHDSTLELGRVDPGDVVCHVASDEEGWICDGIWADTDMALFDEFDRLDMRKEAAEMREDILQRPSLPSWTYT